MSPVTRHLFSTAITAVVAASLLACLVGCNRNKTTENIASAPVRDGADQQQASAPAASVQSVRELTGPLDHVTTAAGEVALIEIQSKGEMATKALSLAGRTIYDQNDYYLSVERAFVYPDKRTVLLLAVSAGGTACPSQFRFLSIRSDGSTRSTDEFGTCSPLPTIKLSDDQITVSLPDMRGRGHEAWVYAHEGLSKSLSIDPNVERNAPRLAFTENEPTHVRGTLVRGQGRSPELALHLPKLTKLDGGAGSMCASLVEVLPVNLSEGTSTPDTNGESDFVVTIACPHAGPMITAIQLPGAAARRQSVAATGKEVVTSLRSPLTGEWACKSKNSNGTAFSSAFRFDGNGGFTYVDSQSRLTGTFQPNGVNAAVFVEQATVGNQTDSSRMNIEIGVLSSGPGFIKFDMTLVRLGTVIANDCVSKAVAEATPFPKVNVCAVNPAACAAIERNNDIRSMVQDQRCKVLRRQLSGVPGGDHQLTKAGCQ